jgi:hypothetical protein
MTISRYISDEPQPGIVECEMVDVYGRVWRFVEKTAVVSNEHLDANSSYPKHAEIPVEVLERFRDPRLGDVARINTNRPWGIESVEGETRFDVFPTLLTEV